MVCFFPPMQPATVSRCGMIYMEPSQLGWEPLVISWINTLPDALRMPDNRSLLLELFHWLLPPSHRMLRKHCRVSDPRAQNSPDTVIWRTLKVYVYLYLQYRRFVILEYDFTYRKLFPLATVTPWCPCVDCLRRCSLNL